MKLSRLLTLFRAPKGTQLLVAAMAVAMLALLGGCESLATGPSSKDLPVVTLSAAEHSGLNILWKVRIGLSHEKVTGIYRTAKMLYVMTNSNHLVALDAAAGTVMWTKDFYEAGVSLFPPVEIDFHDRPALLVFTRFTLYILDRRTGETAARTTLDFTAASPGVAAGDLFFVGSEHDFFYGTYIDLLGKPKWTVRAADDAFSAAPVLAADGSLVFASRKGMVWDVNPDDGSAGWNRKTTGEVVGGLAADRHAAYVPSMDRKLFAFDLFSSNKLWVALLDGRMDQTPVVAGANVLVVGSGSGLYACDIVKGDRRWFVPGVTQVLSHSADHVYAADAAGNVLSISLDSGTVDATTPTHDAQLFATNTVASDSTIYVIAKDGRMAAMVPAPR